MDFNTIVSWQKIVSFFLLLNNSAFQFRIKCSRRRQTSVPVPPPGELDETYASSLILARSLH